MSSVTRMPNAALQRSQTSSTTSLLESSFEALHSRIVKDSAGLPIAFKSGTYPSTEERTAAMEAAATVRHALSQVASSEDRAKAIRLLLGTLKAGQGMDAEAMAEGYMFVLEGVKRATLQKAVQNLARGKAPDKFSRTFMPAAPELLDYCEQIERDFLALAVSTERLLSLPEQPAPDEPMSEEHCAAMRERIANLAKSMRAM